MLVSDKAWCLADWELILSMENYVNPACLFHRVVHESYANGTTPYECEFEEPILCHTKSALSF